ncbi:hypothetical protein EAI_16147 [Harpegnathos saltator]|uniref:Uncharacterized protein n=1 Tax=Harpegnathos saltator TaxID=610380 RepID=E2C7R1_HARSA|nr:hypothetical protein EAI_16147 [Harpegnathos saltator]
MSRSLSIGHWPCPIMVGYWDMTQFGRWDVYLNPSEEEMAEETGSRSRSRSKAYDRRKSKIDAVHRSARVFRSRETNTSADDDLRSSVLILRHIQDSKDADGRFAPTDSRTTLGSSNNQQTIESEGNPRASIFTSSEKDTAERGARGSAGMQEDQLLFFRKDRARSSATSRAAEAIGDRKDRPGEQDRQEKELGRRRRRGGERDWFMRTSNRSENFRGHSGTGEPDEDSSSLVDRESASSPVDEEENEWQDPKNTKFDNEPADDDEAASDKGFFDDTSAFEILESIIPLDNKKRKVTLAEDSKDLMVASNFEWTSRDRKSDVKVAIPEQRSPSLSQDTSLERRPRRTGRRRSARQRRRTISEIIASPSARWLEKARGDRVKRYSNYYSSQSATPKAYVHIQPAYPEPAPPTSRKCVRCMFVYKPCPSSQSPQQPPPRPRIVLHSNAIVVPNYKYHEPATNWRGLKYAYSADGNYKTNRQTPRDLSILKQKPINPKLICPKYKNIKYRPVKHKTGDFNP